MTKAIAKFPTLLVAIALGLATLLAGCGGGEPASAVAPERAPLTWDKAQGAWDTVTWQ
jgi:hypothetical protein